MYLNKAHLNKKISVTKALSKITGIGYKMAIQACDQLGVSSEMSLKNLSPNLVNKLNQIIHQNYLVETELRALVKKNKKRLSSISCYRGFRHIVGLPCRGQRTHTNAKNAKRLRASAAH